MERVGIRELRQQASAILRRVQAGESFEVTARGRPVAVLVKVLAPGLARLEQEGMLRPAEGDLLELDPLPVPPHVTLPSRLVVEGRGE
jgi:prevent-host-death family protein